MVVLGLATTVTVSAVNGSMRDTYTESPRHLAHVKVMRGTRGGPMDGEKNGMKNLETENVFTAHPMVVKKK